MRSWRAPEHNLRTVQLASGLYLALGGTTYDLGSNLNAAATDNADGSINFPMKGGKASAAPQNPADATAVGIVFPMSDPWNNPITGDFIGTGTIELDWPTSVPVSTDNITVGLFVSNESAMSGSTRDGISVMVEFNSLINANPRVRIDNFVNAADGSIINGASTSGVRGTRLSFLRTRAGVSILNGLAPILGTSGLDSSGIAVSGAGVNFATATPGVANIGTGTIFGGLWLVRNNAANASVFTAKPRVRYTYSAQCF